MADRPWFWMLGAAIPMVWIWFALLGIRWDVLGSLLIAMAATILLGTLYAVIESPRSKEASGRKNTMSAVRLWQHFERV